MKIITVLAMSATLLTACGEPMPTKEEQATAAASYPATVLSKHYEKPTTRHAYAPWMPSGLKWVEVDTPEKFTLNIRYCPQVGSPADCQTLDTPVTKELYDKVDNGSKVTYKDGEVTLP